MLDVQFFIVGLCVAAAASWLIARAVRSLRGKARTSCGAACGDCDRRSEPSKNATDGFVSVDQLLQRKS